MRTRISMLALMAVLGLVSSPAVAQATSQRVYVGNAGTTMTGYPLTAAGNVAPSTDLSFSTDVGSLAFDSVGDLWVGLGSVGASAGVIDEYSPNQLGLSGSVAPKVSIDTSAEIDSGGAFDAAGDLWFAGISLGTVSEYSASQLASSSSAPEAPAVTITGLDSPNGVAFDASGDMWVSDYGADTVSEFTPADLTSSGSPTPAVVISGSDLSGPARLSFDAAGDLWVANHDGDTVVEYTPAQLAATGSPTPNVILSASSGSLDAPNGLDFDASGDLWVVNEAGTSVVEFSPAELAATGSPAPIDTITGSATGITNPYVLAVGPGPPAVTIQTTSVPGGRVGTAYGTALTACGGVAPSCEHYSTSAGELVDSSGNPVPADEQFTFTVASGSLPPGLTLSSQGYLSGTPTQTNTYHFSVVASDPDGNTSGPQSYTLETYPKGEIDNGSEASWDTSSTATSASATITVPAVVCAGEKAGTFAGQTAGVELYGQETVSGTAYYPAEVADVRTYCDGTKAEYETSFNDVSAGATDFHPAGLTVSPGDPLEITVSTTSAGAAMKITDVNTGKSASITGPGFVASDGADIGVEPITTNGHGAPMLTGSESVTSDNATLAGPVPSSPVVFDDATVDGQAISAPDSLYGLRWVNSSNTVVAAPSAISGSDFTVDFASAPAPADGKSGDAAPVSGKVLIKLPHTHKFVPLTTVKEIPTGTIINATHGSVQITVTLPNGTTQTGVFFGGEFIFEQAKSGAVTAILTGGSFADCPKPPSQNTKHKKHGPLAQSASASKRKPVRHLWSNAHGSFSTKGHDGAAAVRGTEWLTQDQCDGTYFEVTRDEIEVTAFHLHNHKVLVKQGHHYLAPAPGYT